ncbi:MAG: hypothetical protein MUP66_00790 [Candidatus Nanohaloarchaeota archaeon QJJ-5]|nr:hypothetical protein [Candidatus Nanohaloarchaeota archaeon QJJ-5]
MSVPTYEDQWTEQAIKDALAERYDEWEDFDVDQAYDQLEQLLAAGDEEPYDPPRISTTDQGPVHELYDPEKDEELRFIEEDPSRLPHAVYDGGTEMMADEEDTRIVK